MASPDSWGTGTTQISLSGYNYIDSLVYGYKWGGGLGSSVTVYYSFPAETGDSYWLPAADYGTGELYNFGGGLNATERTAAISALGKWANVAKITFTQTTDTSTNVGDIRFAWADLGAGSQAHAYYPGNYAEAGDVWLNMNLDIDWSDGWGAGGYPYLTLMHELGHALGLKHTFEASGISTAELPPAYDGYHFSIMSYTAWAEDPPNTSSGAYFQPTTPMLYDVAAIQYLYGKNMSYHSGNTTYTFSQNQTYFQTIWDGGGKDTIVWTGTTQSCEIDLRSGYWSGLGDDITFYNTIENGGTVSTNYNVTIAFGATIENATGGGVADLLEGNGVANILTGNGGNDTLNGYGGNDTLNGGVGGDIMKGNTGNDIYYVNATGDRVTELAGQGSDLVKSSISYALGLNVEKLTLTGTANLNATGNSLTNTLTGNSGANKLTGSGGNDVLIGGSGGDTLLGGIGNDTLRGGAANDTLTGGDGSDFFRFDTALSSNIDTITDFNYLNDTIQLDNAIFTRLGVGTLLSSNYRENLTGTAQDANDYILYETDTGRLYYDSNGNVTGGRSLIATLWDTGSTHPTGSEIGYTDFVVV